MSLELLCRLHSSWLTLADHVGYTRPMVQLHEDVCEALVTSPALPVPEPQLAATDCGPERSTVCPKDSPAAPTVGAGALTESLIVAIDKFGTASKDYGVALAKAPGFCDAARDHWLNARSEALAAVGAGAAELPEGQS